MEARYPGTRHFRQATIGRERHVEIGLHAVPLDGANTGDRLGYFFRADREGQPVAQLQTKTLSQLGFNRNTLGITGSEPLPFHQIGRAHVRTPVTSASRMPSS